jgi:hypothetical protein
MKRIPGQLVPAGLVALLSGAGLARGITTLTSLQAAGWTPGPVPANPGAVLAGAVLGLACWLALAWSASRAQGGKPAGALMEAAIGLAPGILGWAVPWFSIRLLSPALADVSFSQLGALRVGESWVKVSTGGYLCIGVFGLALMGTVIGAAAVQWRKSRAPWLAFGLALFAAGAWRTLVFPPTGDEPYILLSVESLLASGNLDLDEEFSRRADRQVRPTSFRNEFEENHRVPGRHGESYTYHGLLLPFLYLPGYALLGRVGLCALLAAVCAVLLRGLTALLKESGFSPGTAMTTTGLLAIASPLPVFTVFLSPDLPTAVLATAGIYACLTGRTGLLLAAVAALPWIHHKSGLISAGLVLGAVLTLGWRKALLAGTTLALSGLALAAVAAKFTAVPVWPPTAFLSFYGSAYQGVFGPSNIPAAVFGTLFDRHQGIVWFPALLLSFAGIFLLRGKNLSAGFLAAVAAPYLAVLLMFNQWAGGSGAPGRMLVVVLPPMAVAMAGAVEFMGQSALGRRLIAFFFAAGAALLWFISSIPAMAFVSARERVEGMMLERLGLNPLAILPRIANRALDEPTVLVSLMWVLVTALAAAFFVRYSRAGETNRPN